MIDRNSRLHVPDMRGMLVYPDDRIPGKFYAFPDCPRIGLDDKQRPQMRLTLYGKPEALGFRIDGGLVTITTSLGLYEGERTQLTASIRAMLKRENPNVVLTWAQMIWADGRCNVSLIPNVCLTSTPSLFGDNLCVFQTPLHETTARDLEQAWREGLPDNSVRYELKTQTPPMHFLFEGKLSTDSYDLPSLITQVKLE